MTYLGRLRQGDESRLIFPLVIRQTPDQVQGRHGIQISYVVL
jgi:hypothetical protein